MRLGDTTNNHFIVVPEQAGTQGYQSVLDARLRGHDGYLEHPCGAGRNGTGQGRQIRAGGRQIPAGWSLGVIDAIAASREDRLATGVRIGGNNVAAGEIWHSCPALQGLPVLAVVCASLQQVPAVSCALDAIA